MTWWQGVLALVPLYLGAIGLVGLVLGLLAASGHWMFFWVFLGIEAYCVIAVGTLARQRSRKTNHTR